MLKLGVNDRARFCAHTAGMQLALPTSQADPASPSKLEADVMALCGQVSRAVAVAETLVRNHRQVCVAGLQDQVGLLCAKALDLPPGRKGLLRFEMKQLAHRIASLEARFRSDGTLP